MRNLERKGSKDFLRKKRRDRDLQSLTQMEKNYGKKGAEIIRDNVQDTTFYKKKKGI